MLSLTIRRMPPVMFQKATLARVGHQSTGLRRCSSPAPFRASRKRQHRVTQADVTSGAMNPARETTHADRRDRPAARPCHGTPQHENFAVHALNGKDTCAVVSREVLARSAHRPTAHPCHGTSQHENLVVHAPDGRDTRAATSREDFTRSPEPDGSHPAAALAQRDGLPRTR